MICRWLNNNTRRHIFAILCKLDVLWFSRSTFKFSYLIELIQNLNFCSVTFFLSSTLILVCFWCVLFGNPLKLLCTQPRLMFGHRLLQFSKPEIVSWESVRGLAGTGSPPSLQPNTPPVPFHETQARCSAINHRPVWWRGRAYAMCMFGLTVLFVK